MSFLNKLFHRSDRSDKSESVGSLDTGAKAVPYYPRVPDDGKTTAVPIATELPPDADAQVPPPQQTAPFPLVQLPPPPHSNPSNGTRSAAQNVGMLAGASIATESGGNPTMGMVDGLVVGNMVSQRLQQHKKHEYWREQAGNYQAGLPAQGVGDPRVAETPNGGRERERSSREERRKKRWDQRAGRAGKRGSSGDELVG